MDATRLVVFAKVPEPGRVKTRLARRIGERAAATLAERMLRHTLEQAALAGVGPVELCAAPSTIPMRALAAEFDLALAEQGGGDLGERLARASARHLARASKVLIIGTDCPALDAEALREAARQLRPPRTAVVRPALDGGYVLIGLQRRAPELFSGIPWSTAAVMARTREALRRHGHSWWEGPPLADVDEPADLVRLPREWLAALGEARGRVPDERRAC